MPNKRFSNTQIDFLKSIGLSADSDAADIEGIVSKKLMQDGFDKGHKNINQMGIMCEAILDIIGDEYYETLMKMLKKNREERDAYQLGDLEDSMSEECRKIWTKKCNS